MKYVALKDGSIMTFYDNADYMQYDNVRENFLKEGNSIEELCDGFYIDETDYLDIENIFINYYEFKPILVEKAQRGIDVYGFIKTDKGLIYVAKMNKNGEFELI